MGIQLATECLPFAASAVISVSVGTGTATFVYLLPMPPSIRLPIPACPNHSPHTALSVHMPPPPQYSSYEPVSPCQSKRESLDGEQSHKEFPQPPREIVQVHRRQSMHEQREMAWLYCSKCGQQTLLKVPSPISQNLVPSLTHALPPTHTGPYTIPHSWTCHHTLPTRWANTTPTPRPGSAR